MKTSKLRTLIPLTLLVVAGVTYAAHQPLVSSSAIGWQNLSLLCPIGALSAMLAGKAAIPRALVSVVAALAIAFLLGRALCAWACPVPLLAKLRRAFRVLSCSIRNFAERAKQDNELLDEEDFELSESATLRERLDTLEFEWADEKPATKPDPLPVEQAPKPSRSRYVVLVAALASSAVFGFPVFCLVCPVGLTFALLFAIIGAFSGAGVGLSLAAIPLVLIAETLLFRRWCSHICPIGAFMGIVGHLNRTFRPHIDTRRCLEASRGATCGQCAASCEWGLDPRNFAMGSKTSSAAGSITNPEAILEENSSLDAQSLGDYTSAPQDIEAGPKSPTALADCTRCRSCAESCPAKAISFPFVPRDS